MKSRGMISSYQLFAILLLSRMTALFTFMLPTTGFLLSGDRLLTTLPLMIIELIYCFFSVLFISKAKNRSITASACKISPALGKAVCIFYVLCFIWFAGISVSRFELFISTVMFPNSELYLMTVILLAAAFYSALKGLEALGRASVIISVLLCTGVIFIILTVLGNFEFTNLTPVLTDGLTPVLSFAFYVSSRTVEFISLYAVAPKVKGSIGKITAIWTVTVTVITAIILTVLAGVTGKYGDDQIFPLYTLTVIAKFGIFERLDDILTGLWVLSTFIQLTFLLTCGALTAENTFRKFRKVPFILLETSGVFTVYLFASKTVTAYSEIVSSAFQDIFFIVLLIIIPALITIIYHFKKRNNTC